MITVEKKLDAGNCLSCGRANYNSAFGAKAEVDLITITVTPDRQAIAFAQVLCPECLARLSQAIHPFRSSIATLPPEGNP